MAGPVAPPQAQGPGPLLAPGRLAPLLALSVLALGALSLWLGQDLNFDLLNYHYYTGYAFLHGRTFRDVAPADRGVVISALRNPRTSCASACASSARRGERSTCEPRP